MKVLCLALFSCLYFSYRALLSSRDSPIKKFSFLWGVGLFGETGSGSSLGGGGDGTEIGAVWVPMVSVGGFGGGATKGWMMLMLGGAGGCPMDEIDIEGSCIYEGSLIWSKSRRMMLLNIPSSDPFSS